MLVKNDWINSNFHERLTDRNSKFIVSFKPYNFKEMCFDDACTEACWEIYEKCKKLYVAFSGGMDSEYILRKFHSLGIPITPVIVCCRNRTEELYAFEVCKELKIVPKVIRLTEYEFLTYYKKYIYDIFGGAGYNSTQVVVAKQLAEADGATLLVGGHLIGEDDECISDDFFAWAVDIDYYADYCFTGTNTIYFYLYSMEIVHAMFPTDYTSKTKWQEYKSRLYGVKYRDKVKAKYSEQTKKVLDEMQKTLTNRNYEIHSWTKSEILEIFNSQKV